MRCPECHSTNQSDAVACINCGLLLLNLSPKRRSDDMAQQRRRANDDALIACRFCSGEIPEKAIRCVHCSEIVNDDFYRERARRIRGRINYASWTAYLFGLAALLVLRPVGIVSIAGGLLLSILYYAIPAEPPTAKGQRGRSTMEFLKRQFRFERVHYPIPATRNAKLVFVGTPLVAALVGYSANIFVLQRPMDEVLKGNAAFNGMEVSAHYKYWIVPGVIEYDLETLTVNHTPIDVHTALVEFAEKVKERRFSRIDLSYQGVTKFSLDGSDFQQLGQEYANRNLEWVLYKFPTLLKNSDGPVISTSTSGRDALLQFHQKWYREDALTKKMAASAAM